MGLVRRLANLIRRERLDRDTEAELRAHVEMRVDANISAGMSPESARRDALLRFGNITSTREHVAAMDAGLALESFCRDVRYAARRLRRSPGFALTAILTLAVGIGACVVVFGVMNALILRPLNVASADRLTQIVHREQGYDSHSYPDYLDLRARNRTFSGVAAFRIAQTGLSAGGSAQKSWLYEVSGNYFDMLGVQPSLGRLFHANDEHGANSAPFIVLSNAFWRARFNSDPRVIGMTVDLNRHPFTIVGVAPSEFHGTEVFLWPDFWVPMVNEEQVEGYSFLDKRFNHGVSVIGMRKPGVTDAQAAGDLNAVAKEMAREHPNEDGGMELRLVKPGLMADTFGGPARAFLAGMMALAFIVLLAACTNLAGIVIARMADRTRELAIRMSIGSTRWRLLRQLLAETAVLCLAGGAAGTAFAVLMLNALSRWHPIPQYPIHVTTVADARVWLAALALSLFSALLPAVLPAGQVWRTDAMQAIKAGTAGQVLLRRLTLRDALLTVQIAVCAVLVTASLVAVRGMERSLHAPLGFHPENVVLAETDLAMSGYPDQQQLRLERSMLDEAARIPGVTAVGSINGIPLNGGGSSSPIFREGVTDFRPQNIAMTPKYYAISPGYLHAAQTRLLAGRDFTWADNKQSPSVAIVNRTFAHTLFGNAPAVGRHFVQSGGANTEIVGVVEDGKYDTLTEDPTPAMFFPLGQYTDSSIMLVVRSRLAPSEIIHVSRGALTGIDPSLPLTLETWPDALALPLFPARIATAVLSILGLLAAMLAITGVFGMAAYSVSRRLRELGIRVALGARRAQVMRAALARPVVLLAAGSLAGLVLGVAASRILAAIVYQATPRDPLVVAGSLLAMLLVGLVAIWIPARRALGVDPARLLRED
jgi:predicted permease